MRDFGGFGLFGGEARLGDFMKCGLDLRNKRTPVLRDSTFYSYSNISLDKIKSV